MHAQVVESTVPPLQSTETQSQLQSLLMTPPKHLLLGNSIYEQSTHRTSPRHCFH